MSLNRKLPFGYCYDNGVIAVNVLEAPIVRAIYESYIQGKSIQSIASEITQAAVPYRTDATVWNKNMVLRILDNKKYGGQPPFPAILPNDLMQACQARRTESRQKQLVNPCIRIVRSRLGCGLCGGCLIRKKDKRRDAISWCCTSCGMLTAPIADDVMIQAIQGKLSLLCQNPAILRTSSDTVSPSSAVLRMNYELHRRLTDPTAPQEELCRLANLAAEALYDSISDEKNNAETEFVAHRLSNSTILRAEFSVQLFLDIVAQVIVSPTAEVSLRLLNNQMI